jgi:NAD+ kinase
MKKSSELKVVVRGRFLEDIIPLIEKKGIKIVNENPDLIITHGGDGALLGAEREYPGIPKFPIRDERTAPLCEEHSGCDRQIDSLLTGRLKKTEIMKLCGKCKGGALKALNDIFIHNQDPVSAIRYKVWIDGRPYGDEIVGDGAGVATVHGSTAYYRSITHSVFKIGIGLAFSNSTELTNHLVLPENSKIRVVLTRGPAVLVADNNPNKIELKKGDAVEIEKGEEKAVLYGLDAFMCLKCRKLRHPRD